MCTDPQSIYSNSRRYRPSLSRLSVDVPCGHCPDCLSQSHDEWFLRIWQEIQDTNSKGGKVVFLTLTYSDSHLPYYYDVDEESGEVIEFPCFNKNHKDIFLDSLRSWFRKVHGISGKNVDPIKFFWACEYGMDERFTMRPHYHVLLHLPAEYLKFFESKQALKDKLQSYWPYGIIRWSKEEAGGIFVDREFAATYVSKYCGKDIDFYSRPDVKDYLYPDGKHKDNTRYEKFKPFRPRHWQSKSYGIGLMQYCEDDQVFKDGLDLSFCYKRLSEGIKQGDKKLYKVPRYIERKCLREYDEFGSLVLNDRGKRVYSDVVSFREKVKKLIEHNDDLWRLDTLLKYTDGDYTRAERALEQYNYLLAGRDPVVYVCYLMLYRGLIYDNFGIKHSDYRERLKWPSFNKDNFDVSAFLDYSEKLYKYKIEGFDLFDPFFEDGFVNFYHDEKKKYILYDDFPLFSRLNDIFVLSLELKSEYRARQQLKYELERLEKKKYKLLTA